MQGIVALRRRCPVAGLLLVALAAPVPLSAGELELSTYLAGSRQDWGLATAIDRQGHVLVAGFTESPDFPVAAALQPDRARGNDAFVTKLERSGGGVVFSTYLGGGGDDGAHDVAVDAAGNIYVVGSTCSVDFPVVRPVQAGLAIDDVTPGARNCDAFVTKLNPEGGEILFSTYLGGARQDYANAVAVDDSGVAYVAGPTASLDFPTVRPLQADRAGDPQQVAWDVFVTAIDTVAGEIVFSTYWGGPDAEEATHLALDSRGHLWVAGTGSVRRFPVVRPLREIGTTDHAGFILKIDPHTPEVLTSQRLPLLHSLAVNRRGEAHILATARPTDRLAGVEDVQSACGEDGDVLFRVDPAATLLSWSCLPVSPGPMTFDRRGRVVIAGGGRQGLPVKRPLAEKARGGGDFYVAVLKKDLRRIRFGSYMGGSAVDYALDVAYGGGLVAVTGITRSYDFPAVRAVQEERPGRPGARAAFAAAIRP